MRGDLGRAEMLAVLMGRDHFILPGTPAPYQCPWISIFVALSDCWVTLTLAQLNEYIYLTLTRHIKYTIILHINGLSFSPFWPCTSLSMLFPCLFAVSRTTRTAWDSSLLSPYGVTVGAIFLYAQLQSTCTAALLRFSQNQMLFQDLIIF